MSKTIIKNILEHPDKDEIISKLIIGILPKDLHESLKAKYTNVGEKKFILSEKSIESFKDDYLDIYNDLKEDILKTKDNKISNKEVEVELSIKNNKKYKERLSEYLDHEIDIKLTIKKLIVAIEARAEQVFDKIQEDPRNVGKADYVLIQYFNTLSTSLEKLNKILNDSPDQVIQHNITLQVLDQHIFVFQDLIKDILAKLDLQASLEFMDLFNEKMKKLKPPSIIDPLSTEERLTEVKLLGEKITKL